MPEPLQFNKDMGSVEAHIGVMKNRVETAKAEYERVRSKPGISPEAIDNAREVWEASQSNYEKFMESLGKEDKTKTSPTIH